MALRRIALRREAATFTMPGLEKFAVQAARRIVRIQERRRKLKRELKVLNDELRIAKGQLRAVTRANAPAPELDDPWHGRKATSENVPFGEEHTP